jgi:hypothetical protein
MPADRARSAPRARPSRPEDSSPETHDDVEAYDDPEAYDDLEAYDERDPLSPADVVRAASAYIGELTGKELCGAVSLEPLKDGWLVGVEVIEDRRIPSSNDLLGLYRTELDPDGSLVTYGRVRRYLRGRGDSDNGS